MQDLFVVLGVKICLKFEGINFTETFSAKMELCKIDPLTGLKKLM
jgi:hypothetical protein